MRDHNATASPPTALGAVAGPPAAVLAYLGGLGLLAVDAIRAVVRPRGNPPPFAGAVLRQVDWMFLMGAPLVMLANTGMGSFLAMQAFYGATFIDGTGPVVGSGLIRNLAPLLCGMVFSGLFAARMTSELRRSDPGLDADPLDVPDRDVSLGLADDDREAPDPGRLAAVRILAAMIAGPPLVLWAAAIGIFVGAGVARTMLAMPMEIFFSKMLEMLWIRDVVGLVVKGVAFSGVAALFACHEGILARRGGASDPASGPFRAAVLSMVAILALNNSWFTVAYIAGPAFGPTVLTPPPH